MKKVLSFSIISLLFSACSTETEQTPKAQQDKSSSEITKTLQEDEEGPVTKHILVSAGTTKEGTEIKMYGSKFDLVVENNKDTVYLATSQKLFHTPEKHHVGMKFSELPKATQKKIQEESGWGYYIKLPSGWNLGFCEGASCTDSKPTDDSTVKWVFKRK
jgi:hypothetical protein